MRNLCVEFFCKMVSYSHIPFICNQDEDYAGSELG